MYLASVIPNRQGCKAEKPVMSACKSLGFSPNNCLIFLCRMRLFRTLALLPALALSGCHSSFVTAVIANRSSQPIDLIEVSYPSASFGTQSLAPGSDFQYRFKVLGDGNIKLTYTDSAHHERKSEGPFLKEGAEGPITITILPGDVRWQNNTRTH